MAELQDRGLAERVDAIVRWTAIIAVAVWVPTLAVAAIVKAPGYPSFDELIGLGGVPASDVRFPTELVWYLWLSAFSNIAQSIAFGSVGIAVARKLVASARRNETRYVVVR